MTWSPDSRRVAYVSWRNGTPQVFEYDFTTGTERQLTDSDRRDVRPIYSPDGRYLAYNRGGQELRVIELESGRDRLLASGTSGNAPYAWSPDSRWIAYGGNTDEFNNAMVVPLEGGEARQVSFLADTNFGSLGWSAGGDFLAFRTSQRTEPGKLVRVDLVPRTPTFREDRFWELFNVKPPEDRQRTDAEDEDEPTEAGAGSPDAPAEVEIDFRDIRRRGHLVDLDFSVGSVVLSPDGEHAAVTEGGRIHYVTFDQDGEVQSRLLARPQDDGSSGGGMGSLQFSADGSQLYMLRGGRVRVTDVGSGETRTISTTAEHPVDFEREKIAVFQQAWAEMRDGFYDPELHGTDWDAVRERFAPRVGGARTPAGLSRILNLMVGELNGSHLGHRMAGGAGDGPVQTGRLGLRFDRPTYEAEGRFRVSDVVELGPAHVAGVGPGEYVLEVNGTALDGSTDLHALLAGTPGDKVTLAVGGDPAGSAAREVELEAIRLGAERQLVYRSWVESRRAYVDSLSDGRLGYVHMASMSSGALDQLLFDLDQVNHAKEGVVVDVRNNSGGFVNVYAIDVFSRQNYFTMRARGGVTAPSRVRLGQRALLAPTALVTNKHTLSDGEDFTEGYRTLGLGPVVGEPTAGWIIYTGNVRLVNGSSIRMPRTEVRDSRGEVMELVPRPVDIRVERPAGERYTGRDSQLERAVEELLDRLDMQTAASDR